MRLPSAPSASRLIGIGLASGWVMLLIGIAVHLTIRDGSPRLAMVFYGLPLPVLGGIAIGLALCRGRGNPARFTAAVLALILVGVWLSRSFHWNTPVESENGQDLTVLVWNLSRPTDPSEKLIELIREHEPDVVSVVEPGRAAGSHLKRYEEELPGYEAAWMPRGILWLSKVPSRYRSRGKLDNIGAYAWFEVQHPSGPFRFVAVDVFPYPQLPRGPQLKDAYGWTEDIPHAILAGDFNTPVESVHFRRYRQTLTNAFEEAGRGFRETWFWGLPLLSLDQIWCGAEWKPLQVKKIHTTASDHAALLARFRRLPSPESMKTGSQQDKPSS
jgi:endonuclease/exonuclease/phosphatase (EEP) superfamily protein YafD